MRRYQSIATILLVSLATGCQTTGETLGPSGPVRELVVNRPVTFPLGGGDARFQYGARTTAVNTDDPYCFLLHGAGSRVEPGTFAVTGIKYGYTKDKGENLPEHSGFYQETRLLLHSPAQPGIRQLVCRGRSATGGNLNSIEIQAILGQGFTLR